MAYIPLRNRIRSVIGGFFRRPMIRAKDRFLRTARTSCHSVQIATLKRLLQLNQHSDFSSRHNLDSTLSLRDFQNRIPVSDYEYIRPYINRVSRGEHSALLGAQNRLLMFAISSGTTAAPKLIPITNQFVRDYRRGWQHWGISTQQAHPELSNLRIVQIASKHNQSKTEDGTPCGSISGLVTLMQRRIVRKLYTVPAAVCDIGDATDKRHAVARFAFADPHVGMLITANPSTLLQLVGEVSPETIIRDIHDGTLSGKRIDVGLAHRLKPYLKACPPRARELQAIVDERGHLDPQLCWKQLLCLGVWTGGSAGAYIPSLKRAFGNLPLRDHGLHASEGRMTIPFHDNTPAGVLDIESHFFEFIPVAEVKSEQPVVLLADELKEGGDYYILLTTSSGLYRYNINDVVRCTGFLGTTPLLEFRHKGAHMSSITGEKISEAQVVDAVGEACAAEGISLSQFTVTPSWGSPPWYQLYVNVEGKHTAAPTLQQLAERCDQALRVRNCEYEEKRRSGRLGSIKCEVLPEHAWQHFRNSRLLSTGGSPEQYKHVCLLADPKFENKFLTAAGIDVRQTD